MKHALLSASSSNRWINCPPSARLCEKIIDGVKSYALEGTEAHSLCEYKLKTALGVKLESPIEKLKFYNDEMEECTSNYANYCLEVLESLKEKCKDPLILIEQKLDFSRYVPEGFGTSDALILGDTDLYVIDFKYGKGVEVLAQGNTQMMCYGLGAVLLLDGIYDISNIHMTIFQPRLGNISTYSLSKEELYKWADEVLKHAANLAYKGIGDFKVGEHCRFCKVKATCRKCMEHNMELLAYDFKEPATISNEEIAELLPRLDELVAWANDVKEYALVKAQKGAKFSGYKLVEGRSTRKYVDEQEVAKIVEGEGYDPYDKKLLGITAMTKLLGKKEFDELLGNMVYKPKGKPTLVSITDKRPEINIFDEFKGDTR